MEANCFYDATNGKIAWDRHLWLLLSMMNLCLFLSLTRFALLASRRLEMCKANWGQLKTTYGFEEEAFRP